MALMRLLTAVAISRLTSNAHNNFNKASHLDHTLTDLNEFGHWLLSIPHDQLLLSAIAARVVQTFRLPYCSIHVYVEGKWHHFTGAAGTVISPEIAGKLKVIEDHSTNLMELVEEHESGARYIQIKQGDSPLALLVVKGGDALPANALGTLGNMIGVRINEALQNRSSLPVNFPR